MTHVITQRCCNDAACVPVCPVNCIHPRPDEPGYLGTEMLYIDPDSCIDCGACVSVCPVSAIAADEDLEPEQEVFEDLNAAYFELPGHRDYEQSPKPVFPRTATESRDRPLRVAIVGSGPAGCYVAQDLLAERALDVRIDIFERLPVPGGLVRFGVAPDHYETKDVQRGFDKIFRNNRVRLLLDVEIGTDISHDQLAEAYDAVVYAYGAQHGRLPGIPGDGLPGSHAGLEFVAWYNGHPDYADLTFDLSGERAVIIGNGNVALDIARILAADPETLARTDIAEHALQALRESAIREICVLARRGPDDAAFTVPELIGLRESDDYRVRIEPKGLLDQLPDPAEARPGLRRHLEEIEADTASADRSIVLRFFATPRELVGGDAVEGLRIDQRMPEGEIWEEVIETPLVISAIGYQGHGLPTLPVEVRGGVLPTDGARVLDPERDAALDGVYAVGWIKRGPSGVIGTNKYDARDVVGAILEDWRGDRLSCEDDPDAVTSTLTEAIDHQGWLRLDRHEKKAGREQKRPRSKVVSLDEMRRIAGDRP